MIKSNTEKQARFRKKEALKRRADQIFRLLQLGQWNLSDTSTPQEIQYNLDKIIELPSDWTDKDFERAWLNLERFQDDFRFSKHLLENDVVAPRNTKNEFTTTPDPYKFIKDERVAVENTRALAAHIISALRLSCCSDSDKAAALMEVVRFVGRVLANGKEIPRSKAVTICLAAIGPGSNRPEWFAEMLSETLGWQVGEDIAHDVGKRLTKFKCKI
jgi:hypothetical protein